VGAVVIVIAVILCFVALRAEVPVSASPTPRGILALFFIVACAAALPGALVVFPRAHYLVAPCAFGFVLAGCGVLRVSTWAARDDRGPRWGLVAIACLGAVLACVVPSSAAAKVEAAAQPNRNAERALKRLALPRLHVLELSIGFAAIAGYDYPTWTGWEKTDPMYRFLTDRDIGVIVIWEPFLEHPAFADDPEARDLLSAPERRGWCIAYSDPQNYRVLVRTGALDDGERRRICSG
jgi:hypothetical protein